MLLLVLCTVRTQAQPQFSQWVFGAHAGIDLNGSAPQASGIFAMDQLEGSASVADDSGALLFYTDGRTIWNASHQPMANGSGLLGDATCTQAAAIAQDPAHCRRYYVFSNGFEPDNHVHYSVVDMDLDGGQGDVVPGLKNIPLAYNVEEKLLVLRHATDMSLWVLVHNRGSNVFRAFLLNAGGTQPAVTSAVGQAHPAWAYAGQLKANADGTRLVSVNNQAMLELFDFDAASGVVSNPVAVHQGLSTWDAAQQAWMGRSYYGAEFSPNGLRLYVSGDGRLFQYDVTAGNGTAIAATEHSVYVPPSPAFQVQGLQRGPDGRIYATQPGRTQLAVINAPDLSGTACGWVANGVALNGGIASYGLPSPVVFFTDYAPVVDLGADRFLCPGDSVALPGNSDGDHLWSTGATAPFIFATEPGMYWLEVTTDCGTARDTVWVQLQPLPDVQLINPGVICPGDSLVAYASDGSMDLIWNTGTVGSSIQPTTSGTYSVQLAHACGHSIDSAFVHVTGPPTVELPHSTPVCDEPLVVEIDHPAVVMAVWSTGHHGTTASFPLPGAHWVLLTDTNGCRTQLDLVTTDGCPTQLHVPNAFTPDGDGHNEHFIPVTNRPELVTLTIFDRWGRQLFHGTGGAGWDGTIDGHHAPIGTYIWLVEMDHSADRPRTRHTGPVTLVR